MSTSSEKVIRKENSAGRSAWGCLFIAWVAFFIPIPMIGIVIGWPLNFVAFVLAIVSMSRLGVGSGILQILASLILSPIFYLFGLSIFVGALVSNELQSGDRGKSIELEKRSSAATDLPRNSYGAATQPSDRSMRDPAYDRERYLLKVKEVEGKSFVVVPSTVAMTPLFEIFPVLDFFESCNQRICEFAGSDEFSKVSVEVYRFQRANTVYLASNTGYCGSGGCDDFLLARESGQWRVLANNFGGIEVLNETGAAYPDIRLSAKSYDSDRGPKGSIAWYMLEQDFYWDGASYKKKENIRVVSPF